MKEFDYASEFGAIKVWRIDDDAKEGEFIVFGTVIDAYAKANPYADNPDDYYGYIDAHLEIDYKSPGWDDRDTQEALEYVDDVPDYMAILESMKNDRY